MHIHPAALSLVALLGLTGCAHDIAFQDAGYAIQARHREEAVVAVIDQDTLNRKVSIRSFMTGITHSWDAQPGEMLKQVADIELPQVFSGYQFATAAPADSARRVVLTLSVPEYRFEDFHAYYTVKATARGPGGQPLLDQTYRAEGEAQGGKMFWGGAFAMKSAVRQSSLDALKKIFGELRADLGTALDARTNKVGAAR